MFDSYSLGKWIYDWTVHCQEHATAIADVAGELWLLLIQLTGKVERAEECMPRIRTMDNKEMIEDFIESGDRLIDKLKKLLRRCETPMLESSTRMRTTKERNEDLNATSSLSDVTTERYSASSQDVMSTFPTQPEAAGLPPTNSALTQDIHGGNQVEFQEEIFVDTDTAISTATSNENDWEPVEAAVDKHISVEQKFGVTLGKNAGIAFVDTIFGKDKLLDSTEKLMASLRLWNLRFDTNCEETLRRPSQ